MVRTLLFVGGFHSVPPGREDFGGAAILRAHLPRISSGATIRRSPREGPAAHRKTGLGSRRARVKSEAGARGYPATKAAGVLCGPGGPRYSRSGDRRDKSDDSRYREALGGGHQVAFFGDGGLGGEGAQEELDYILSAVGFCARSEEGSDGV